MILYYAILILYYYYSTNIQEQIISQNFLWKFLRWMDEIFWGGRAQNLEIAVWETYRRTKAKIAVKCDVCVVNGFCLYVICPIFANIVTSVYRDGFIYLSSPPISPVIITVFCGEM